MAGDWDGSLEMADRLARVPDMAAHVRAAGLLVLVARGEPAAAERLAWARGLTARLNEHVLLALATASAEIDLAAWAGDPATALSRMREIDRRLVEAWGDDRLATLRVGARLYGANTQDISQGGVKLEVDEPLPVGASVVLTLDGFHPVSGTVRWCHEGAAGVQFNSVVPFKELMGWLRGERWSG